MGEYNSHVQHYLTQVVFILVSTGVEIPYSQLRKWLAFSSSGYKWDANSLSPYFNIRLNGSEHQVRNLDN